MAPLLLPCLVGSLTRQLSQVARCAAFGSFPAVGAQRCISTITAATLRFRGVIYPVREPHVPFLSPLLGPCQQLLCVQPAAGMKTKTALKRRCKDCFSSAAVEGCLFFANPTPDTSSGRAELFETLMYDVTLLTEA